MLPQLNFFPEFVSSILLWLNESRWKSVYSSAGDRLSEISHQRRCWLIKRLRRFPYWKQGHLTLAWTAISLDDTALAYASAQAVLQLAKGKADGSAAYWIIGKCFLHKKDFQAALNSLQAAQESGARRPEFKEDLAAVYMGLEQYPAALQVLQSVPISDLSMPGQSALTFCLRRAKP